MDQKKNKGELLPYLANVNVRWGSFDLDDLREMRFEHHELDRYGLKSGDIVMCEGGEPGRCALWKEQKPGMMIQKALHRIRPHNCLLSEFLFYYLLYKRFIDLEFFPEPVLTYRGDGKHRKLYLNDRSRAQQIFFSHRLYRPHKTNLRLESLVFFLDWLTRNEVGWKFEDYCNLTMLVLKARHRINLFYSYCLSVSDLQNTALSPGDYAINLHMWNDGPSSPEATKYAKSMDVTIYNQNQFFAFCHRNIK